MHGTPFHDPRVLAIVLLALLSSIRNPRVSSPTAETTRIATASAEGAWSRTRNFVALKLGILKPPDQLLAVMTVFDKYGANQDDLGFVMDLQRPSATNSSRLEVAEQLVQDQQSDSPVRVAQTMERLAMHTRSLNKQAYFSLLDKPLL